MTRINLVPPQELHDKHLVAEYFELPRVFTAVKKKVDKGKTPSDYSHLTEFRFGAGHVTFFYTRLEFLSVRYRILVHEMVKRNFNVKRLSVINPDIPIEWYGMWTPTDRDIELSRDRINERLKQMGAK